LSLYSDFLVSKFGFNFKCNLYRYVEVVCMSCGDLTPRRTLQRQMAGLNPGLAATLEAAVDAAAAAAGGGGRRPRGVRCCQAGRCGPGPTATW
jgi:hypothetical protein